jgi:hypothetical protein
MNANDEILTEIEAAAFLRIAPQSLRFQRCKGQKTNGLPMIPWIQLGRSIRYRKSDIIAVVEAGRSGDAA